MRLSALLVLLFNFSAFSKPKKITYIQFDVAIAIKGNGERGEMDIYNNRNDSWFLPDGLTVK